MARKWTILTRVLLFIPVVWVISVVALFCLLLLDGEINTKSFENLSKRWDIKKTSIYDKFNLDQKLSKDEGDDNAVGGNGDGIIDVLPVVAGSDVRPDAVRDGGGGGDGKIEEFVENDSNFAAQLQLAQHDELAEPSAGWRRLRTQQNRAVYDVNKQAWEPDKPQTQNDPGYMGRALNINEANLSDEEKVKHKEGWDKYQFNEYASSMISVHRTLPDVRPKACKTIDYDVTTLPDTSIIVVFRNEAWSTLLRTIHSCMTNAPPELVRQFILVDDYSDFEHLGKPLEEYVAKPDKVTLLRAEKREGLIRSRLLGSAIATGEVLTFLDSHVECTTGWLPPLLAEISRDKKVVICPTIPSISSTYLSLTSSIADTSSNQMGVFNWDLFFTWNVQDLKEKERRRLSAAGHAEPIRSPTMAGGLFSIHRDWFEKLGTYDAGMDFWGGENLEISFKIWMCGGTLEIHPCSHVGHIFRTTSPHHWPVAKGAMHPVKRNAVRVAEVWLDEYRVFYYERSNYPLGDYGDVTDRKALRENLQCKSFEWYMNNVWPSGLNPKTALKRGEIRNVALDKCFDSTAKHQSKTENPKIYRCHSMGGNQYWMWMPNGEIRRDTGCFDYDSIKNIFKVFSCHGRQGNQQWQVKENGQIVHVISGRCLQGSRSEINVGVADCLTGNRLQQWNFQLYKIHMPNPDAQNIQHLLTL